MIDDPGGCIECDVCGNERGPTIVFIPGSCSTGAAWRPVIAAHGDRFRCVTTSLPGYGRTAERRTIDDPAISRVTEVVFSIIRHSGQRRVHLVGHSFGGLVALAASLQDATSIASLTVVEAPAAQLLESSGEPQHYRAFRDMTDAYFAGFRQGDTQAIAAMIDFYGGTGTFASWPARVRAYALETTAVNILDWASAYTFPLSPSILSSLQVPLLVLRGGASHPAVQRANELLSIHANGADLKTITDAAHFMISTHAEAVAGAIVRHIVRVESA